MARATLRTDSWDAIYTLLKTTDPISTTHIYAALNDKLVSDVGYPFVIISVPAVSYEKISIGGSITQSEIAIMIEVYHTSSQNVKALADEVTDTILTNRAALATSRLMNVNIDDGDYDVWDNGDKKIHRITFNMKCRFVKNG